jgi:VWFA-related protein
MQQDGSRQGLVWIDEATKRIVRLRTDASFTRDIRFVPVNFPSPETTLWLPSSATVHARFAAGELHTVHRFSDYHTEPKNDTGQPASPVALADDPFEVLLKGVVALDAGKPEHAVNPLRDAARRLADRVEPGYYLGLALYETHDLAAAETHFRDTVKRSPSLAVAHNELGAVLFERGDKPGAVAEFQEALRLEPANAGIFDNLTAAARELTIQVNVRQVLVPVVVTDKQRHHVTGLKQADFKVFEDGVEQRIEAFSSERADVSTPANPTAEPSQSNAVAALSPKPLPKRHAYVICLDLMHASFGNFVHVREALQKLFREEQPGDSQYAVIALGRSIEIVQNTTSDPAKVLETLGRAAFRKIYQQSQAIVAQSEISQFESELQEVRAACDMGNIECNRKPMLPTEANQLSEHERFWTTKFAAELRSVVEQLADGHGRRMLVLISDGFSLAPGGTSFGLLEAYFPEFRSTRTIERIQDVIEPIYKLAAKGNVPIYTIDSRGLYTPPGYDVSRGVLNTRSEQRVEHHSARSRANAYRDRRGHRWNRLSKQ